MVEKIGNDAVHDAILEGSHLSPTGTRHVRQGCDPKGPKLYIDRAVSGAHIYSYMNICK